MKLIALYLPQFHTIPENDKWWGEGFTEWVNVKKAAPLFDGHRQPRVPLKDNYYDLSDVEVMRWQTEIAKKYGIYGFCFYHYWFNGKLLLEKPVEKFLNAKEIDFHYCISWANEHWTNQWVSDKWDVLIEQTYGNREEWKKHFMYLLPFFRDSRYIRYKEKPVFLIYKPELIEKRREMLEYWDELAREEGFKGLCFIFQRAEILLNNSETDLSMFDYCAQYQPGYAVAKYQKEKQRFQSIRRLKRNILLYLSRHFKFDPRSIVLTPQGRGPRTDDYDFFWERILSDDDAFPKTIPTAFVDWDNTPRRHERGSVMVGASPEKYKSYLKRLINKSRNCYETDLIFIFAWNEWAEGGYLEPDNFNGYKYLEATREALMETEEYPCFTD